MKKIKLKIKPKVPLRKFQKKPLVDNVNITEVISEKIKNLPNKNQKINVSTPGKKIVSEITEAKHTSDITARTADFAISKNTSHLKKLSRITSDKEWRDENNNIITYQKMLDYQEIVGNMYRDFVILTEQQREELSKKIPTMINGCPVKVGSKAVFPHSLDIERKKISRGRIIYKMNRLKYISSDERRGLKLSAEQANEVFDRYKLQASAKKDLVRTLISLNYTDYEICEFMDIKPFELSRIKKEVFYETITIERNLNNEERYAQYKLQQMEIIKDIDVLVERFKTTQQLQALSSILKTKSEITNNIIEKGYEFGVIEKTPEKAAVLVGGVNLSEASMETLEKELQKASEEIQKLTSDKTFLTKSTKRVLH